MTIEKMYTIDEVAEALNVNHQTVRRHIKDGKIKAIKLGSQYRIRASDYDTLITGVKKTSL